MRALLAEGERRRVAADGAPPDNRVDRADDSARRIFWDELLPAALNSGAAIDYEALHREARRLAAERIAAGTVTAA